MTITSPIEFYLAGCVLSGAFLLYVLMDVKEHNPALFERVRRCEKGIFAVVLSSWAFIFFAIYVYFHKDE